MQLTINIFTIIGSSLGVIAFIISIINPIQVYNTKQWTKLNSLLDLKDLEELCNGVSYGVLYKEPSNRLKNLIYLIKNDFEEVNFKGFTGKRINNRLQKIRETGDRFYGKVQVPNWDFVKNNPEHLDKQLNKDYIFKNCSSDAEAQERINKAMSTATSEIEEIIYLYRSIHQMATKLPIEYLYKK